MSMTLDDFRSHASVWGGDIGRWPADVRAAAEALAAAAPAAAAVLGEARALDRLIGTACPAAVAETQVDRSIRRVVNRLARAEPAHPLAGLWRWLVPTASFASAAALGVLLAFAHPEPGVGADGGDLLVSIMLSGGGGSKGVLFN